MLGIKLGTLSAIQCPPFPIHDHHVSLSVTSFKFGGIALFSCIEGFILNSTSTLHCDSEGRWSGPQPLCIPVTCPPPPTPLNGHLIESPSTSSPHNRIYREGDVAIYTCRKGFMLTGSDFSICQRNGRWRKLAAICQPYCRFPGRPEHGNATFEPREYYLVGEKIVYYCTKAGYKLAGENVLECLGGSQWSRPLPSCKPAKSRNNL